MWQMANGVQYSGWPWEGKVGRRLSENLDVTSVDFNYTDCNELWGDFIIDLS